MDDSEGTNGPETGATVPAVVRRWAEGVAANDEYTYTFEDAVVDVPSRFEADAPTARWWFDGTLTVRVRESESGSGE